MEVRRRAKLSKRTVELQEVGQILQTFVVYIFERKEKQFIFNSNFNRKLVKDVKDRRYVTRPRSLTDEPCSVFLNCDGKLKWL